MMKIGNTRRVRSVAALMQPIAKKYAFILTQDPVVMVKSQYFAMGWQTHAKPKAEIRLYRMETTMTTYTVTRKPV